MVIKNPVAHNIQGSQKKEQFYQTMFKNINSNGLQQQNSRDGSTQRVSSKTTLRITSASQKSKLQVSKGEGSGMSVNKTKQRVQQIASPKRNHHVDSSTSGSRTRRKSSAGHH
jgi:hypothetical protein